MTRAALSTLFMSAAPIRGTLFFKTTTPEFESKKLSVEIKSIIVNQSQSCYVQRHCIQLYVHYIYNLHVPYYLLYSCTHTYSIIRINVRASFEDIPRTPNKRITCSGLTSLQQPPTRTWRQARMEVDGSRAYQSSVFPGRTLGRILPKPKPSLQGPSQGCCFHSSWVPVQTKPSSRCRECSCFNEKTKHHGHRIPKQLRHIGIGDHVQMWSFQRTS